MNKQALLVSARLLKSAEGENIEYDRALLELSAELLGFVTEDEREKLAEELELDTNKLYCREVPSTAHEKIQSEKPIPNSNCLKDMRCPECGSPGPFFITALTDFEMHDDGTESHGDIEYDDVSSCRCKNCRYAHTVGVFKEKKYKVTIVGRLVYSEVFDVVANSPDDAVEKAKKQFEEISVDGASWIESEVTDNIVEDIVDD